jgi:hypothetical protein
VTTICFKTPKAPAPQPSPTRDTNATVVQDARRKTREASGVYGNIFTSVLGDVGYGRNARKVANLGGAAAPAAA